MPIAQYRSKPVQAIQWVGEANCPEVFAFLGWDHPDDELDHSVIYLGNDTGEEAKPGDWIIRHPDGHTQALSPDAFTSTYDPA